MLLVRDPDPLDSSYIPEKLNLRSKEIEYIEGNVIAPLREGRGSTLMAYGNSGVGKTVTAKYLLRENPDFITVYENALSSSSLRQVISDALAKMGRINPGKSLGFDYMFKAMKTLSSEKKKKVLLVIDEARNVVRSDPEGFRNLVMASESYGLGFSAIIISIENPMLYVQSDLIRPGFPVFVLKFSSYTRNELFRILKERCDKSLVESAYDDILVDFIAGIAEQFGSARVAIELLQKAAHLAEYRGGDYISSDDVRAARAMINPFFTESKLSELDPGELITLLSICRCIGSGIRTNVSCVSRSVAQLREEYSMPRIRNFNLYRILRKLENSGLVESRIIGLGDRKGVNKVIEINDLPVSVLSEKIQSLIERLL
jgi:cell division control protein 6